MTSENIQSSRSCLGSNGDAPPKYLYLELFYRFDEVQNFIDGWPNWFRYWKEVVAVPEGVTLDYAGAHLQFGFVPRMTDWTYTTEISDSGVVYIGGLASDAIDDDDCSGWPELRGIDLFAAIVVHEVRHVEQIEQANEFIWSHTNGVGPWKNGWSWNTRWNCACSSDGAPATCRNPRCTNHWMLKDGGLPPSRMEDLAQTNCFLDESVAGCDYSALYVGDIDWEWPLSWDIGFPAPRTRCHDNGWSGGAPIEADADWHATPVPGGYIGKDWSCMDANSRIDRDCHDRG